MARLKVASSSITHFPDFPEVYTFGSLQARLGKSFFAAQPLFTYTWRASIVPLAGQRSTIVLLGFDAQTLQKIAPESRTIFRRTS
jgi:hypothetical protein